MPRTDTAPSPRCFALALATLAWLLAVLLLFLAIRFRVAPMQGDESDLAVPIAFTLSLPVLGGSAALAWPRRVGRWWRLALVSPGILALVALFVACIGVTHRP